MTSNKKKIISQNQAPKEPGEPWPYIPALSKRPFTHSDTAILFEREFHEIIIKCYEETGVQLQVYEIVTNGRLEIHRVGGATVDELRKADRYFLDLQEIVESRQGSYDRKDKNVAYEGLWRKKHRYNFTYPQIAKDIDAVIIDGLSRQLRAGYGYDYVLYLTTLFMKEDKARTLLDTLMQEIQRGNPPLDIEYPITGIQVHNKLKWWEKTKEHRTFVKIKKLR